MNTTPDPRLQEAMAKIIGILKEYDIAGTVALASQEAGEHLFHLCPTWTCMRLEPSADGDVIRIRALRKDFESQEAQDTMVADTISTLAVLARINEDHLEASSQILKCICEKEHGITTITTIRKVG